MIRHDPVEEETKFRDLSKEADVGDLSQEKYQGQRHSRFSNRKGRSRVVAKERRMRMLDELESSAKQSTVKTNNAFDIRSLQDQLAGDLLQSKSLSMSMDNLGINGFQSTIGSGSGTFSKSSKSSKSSKGGKCSKKKTIECENGFTTSVGGKTAQNTTCTEACDGKCCDDGEGGDPCSGLTADICMDEQTCSGGKEACVDANVTSIFKGCSNGDRVCKVAGGEGGNLGQIIMSCNGGDLACAFAAKGYGGTINGNIIHSCNDAPNACIEIAAGGGLINGSIINSCNGFLACGYAAAGYSNYGADFDSLIDGDIEDSCNNYNACLYAGNIYFGSGNGIISSGLYTCCNEESECQSASDDNLPDNCDSH